MSWRYFGALVVDPLYVGAPDRPTRPTRLSIDARGSDAPSAMLDTPS